MPNIEENLFLLNIHHRVFVYYVTKQRPTSQDFSLHFSHYIVERSNHEVSIALLSIN